MIRCKLGFHKWVNDETHMLDPDEFYGPFPGMMWLILIFATVIGSLLLLKISVFGGICLLLLILKFSHYFFGTIFIASDRCCARCEIVELNFTKRKKIKELKDKKDNLLKDRIRKFKKLLDTAQHEIQ